jgi:hypothetical protein
LDNRDVVVELIEWCRRERDKALEAIPLFETGTMRIGHVVEGQLVDQSADHVAQLRRTVEEMNKIIGDYEGKKGRNR